MWFSPMNMMENFGIIGAPFGFMFFGLWSVIRIVVFILVVIDILRRDDLDTLEKNSMAIGCLVFGNNWSYNLLFTV